VIAFPIPVPEGTSPILGIAFGLVAIVGFVVLVWRVVRYWRDERDGGDGDDR
jgi:threonine/homoserine/homoserine lactone efflux protein